MSNLVFETAEGIEGGIRRTDSWINIDFPVGSCRHVRSKVFLAELFRPLRIVGVGYGLQRQLLDERSAGRGKHRQTLWLSSTIRTLVASAAMVPVVLAVTARVDWFDPAVSLLTRIGWLLAAVTAGSATCALGLNLLGGAEVVAFQRQWQAYFEPRVLDAATLTHAEYADAPDFSYTDESSGLMLRRVAVPIVVMALAGIALIWAGFRGYRGYAL